MTHKVYFLGIGGTGMAAVAGLFQAAGWQVTGSDAGIYPPMSGMLNELGITAKTPYAVKNLEGEAPDLCVVANALSRGNVELEAMLAKGWNYTSFPAALGTYFLDLGQRISCVVAGTHGKTTTSSLLAHVLNELGEDPGFMIGGIPRNFPRGFRVGGGPLFVIEGDEYDTAYFDKGPKFLHYRPRHLILNNLEYDHADIYPNVEAIEAQFVKLAHLVADPAHVIANMDDHGIAKVVRTMGLESKVLTVATLGMTQGCQVRVVDWKAGLDSTGEPLWTATIATPDDAWGELPIETVLAGRHNLANVAQVVACVLSLQRAGHLQKPFEKSQLSAAIATFKSVARRLDHLASGGGIEVYEDFAHHPTAVRVVIEGFRANYPDRRLIVAFEPRSATQRRKIFQNDFGKALALADRVFIGECPQDQRIPEDGRMSTAELVATIGPKAQAFPTNNSLLEGLRETLASGDAVIFMSSGSFSGTQHALAGDVRQRSGSGAVAKSRSLPG